MAEPETLLSLRELFLRSQRSYQELQNSSKSSSDEDYQEELASLLKALCSCQQRVRGESIFSINETVDDIQTNDLRYVLVEFYLAKLQLKVIIEGLPKRLQILKAAHALFTSFLDNCERLELMNSRVRDEWHQEREAGVDPGTRRQNKIQRYNDEQILKQKLAENIELQNSLSEHDEGAKEDLAREHLLMLIRLAISESRSEQDMNEQEQQMLEAMVKSTTGSEVRDARMERDKERETQKASAIDPKRKGIEVTRILGTGADMSIRREEIKAGVFQPGWRQPTMSLDEFAENEVKDALERQERNKNAVGLDKKIKELEEDGLEDDHELVNKATIRDRTWDDWKDDNPKGIGNKAGKMF